MGERFYRFAVVRSVLLLAILCISFVCVCAQQVQVTFIVESGKPPVEHESIYIAGNQEKLGMWHPGKVALIHQEGRWSRTIEFSTDTHIEYKFTKGSWENEAMTAEGRVPSNHVLHVIRDTVIYHHIPFWRDTVFNREPQITGDYRIHDDFPAEGLASRRVIVWLPPSYASALERHYPVLYMHDGQNVFDPFTSTLGYDWRVDEIVDSLVRIGAMEEIICVAVYCNPDVRGREYSDDIDLGKKYQEFMAYQLKPWVDSNYRTKPDRAHTAVMGASMGGLISFILAWEYPHVFGMAGCMSPAFKISIGQIGVDYTQSVSIGPDPSQIELYIDNGTLDLEALLQPGIDDMLQELDMHGYRYTWFLDDGAPHNERAWGARVWRPLLQFFGR